MSKLDLAKTDKAYYSANAKPQLVEFDPYHYLAIDGVGEPGGDNYVAHIEALYQLAYAVKFACKEQGNDFVVPKLEDLWWSPDERPIVEVPRSEWCFRLMIRLPDFVSAESAISLQAAVAQKKANPLLSQLKFIEYHEGLSLQVMYTGPYDQVAPTIEGLRAHAAANKLRISGLHHEIFISDPRRTQPAKLKTLIRYPVTPID